MVIDACLHREIVEFLSSRIPEFQNEAGRRVLLLDSGMEELLTRVELSGTVHTVTSLLISHLYRYGTLSNGKNALIHFLQEIEEYVGFDGKEKLQSFQERLRIETN